jgi:hypothetical protein
VDRADGPARLRALGGTRRGLGRACQFGDRPAGRPGQADRDPPQLGARRPGEARGARRPNEEEQRYLAKLQNASQAEIGYAIEQGTKPQTLGYGLTDSPVGQLAWIVEKFKTWSDCGENLESSFTKDELLDNVMVYWLNAAAASSARLYWHSLASSTETFDEVPAPSAYSRFPADNVALSERWARTRYTDLRYYGTPQRGGHFAAYENPAEFVTEVRAGLRALQ